MKPFHATEPSPRECIRRSRSPTLLEPRRQTVSGRHLKPRGIKSRVLGAPPSQMSAN